MLGTDADAFVVPHSWWKPMVALCSLGSLMDSMMCRTSWVDMAGTVRRAKNQAVEYTMERLVGN